MPALLHKNRFAGLFDSMFSHSREEHKNNHSNANYCGCQLSYDHYALSRILLFWLNNAIIGSFISCSSALQARDSHWHHWAYANRCCGDGLFVDDSIIDYVSVPVTMLHNKSANYFAQYASGDSMTGVSINDSDLLIFRKSDTIDSGKIGCFLVGEKAYCKKFMQQDNQIYLMPANENYLPIKIDESTEGFRIVGTLALVLKKY